MATVTGSKRNAVIEADSVDVSGSITVDGTVDGRDVAADGSKLDGIEAGATADQTASEILTAIKTVDGSGSGLDADTLDGQHASAFLTGNQTITLSGDLSGSGTTSINAQIAANAVGANELNVSGNGTAGQYLASDGDGTFSWVTGGGGDAGTLDGIDSTQFLRSDTADTKTSGDLGFSDNVKATFGASSDLQVYHDGANSYVSDTGTGELKLTGSSISMQNATGTGLISFDQWGAGSWKYEGSNAISVGSSGTTIGWGGLNLGDNTRAYFGTSSDLQIYHDGSNSYIDDTGTGNLQIRGNNLYLQKYTGENYLRALADGAVDLYYNNSSKLATTSTGIDVTGNTDTGALTTLAGTVSGTSFNLDVTTKQVFTQSQMSANASFTISTPAGVAQEITFITEGGVSTPSTDGSNDNIGLISSTVPAFYAGNITGEWKSTAFCYNGNGTKVYIWDQFAGVAYQYSLSSAYDLGTASYDSKSFNLGSSRVYDGGWNNNGTKFFYTTNIDGYLYYRSASTAYDISTLGNGSEYMFGSGPTNLDGFTFNNSGTELMLVANDTFYTYALSTAYDPSTASYQTSFSNNTNGIRQLDISPDGRWIVAGRYGNFAGWYMSTANDLSTATALTQYNLYQTFGSNGIRYGVGFDRINPRIIHTTGYKEETGGGVNASTSQHNKIYFGAPYTLTTSETIDGSLSVVPFSKSVNKLLTTDTGATWKVL